MRLGLFSVGVILGGAAAILFLAQDSVPQAPRTEPRPKPPVKSLDECLAGARSSLVAGSFDEAARQARQALELEPHDATAAAILLAAGFGSRYADLADAAIDALDERDAAVDLGKLGSGAFVRREGEAIVFRIGDEEKPLTPRQLRSLQGVRFRITRDHLERASSAEHDLILGVCHLVMRVGPDGMPNESAARAEARERFVAAVAKGDERGRQLLMLLD